MSASRKDTSFAKIKLETCHQAPISFSSPKELKKILSETNEKIHTGVIEFTCNEGFKPLVGESGYVEMSSLVFNQTNSEAIISAFKEVFLRGKNENQSIKPVPDTKAVQ